MYTITANQISHSPRIYHEISQRISLSSRGSFNMRHRFFSPRAPPAARPQIEHDMYTSVCNTTLQLMRFKLLFYDAVRQPQRTTGNRRHTAKTVKEPVA